MFDIAIIGAGIIGSFIAHDLSKYDLKVVVLEKNADIASETTMANSAIIHSGHDPKEGTLKALLNVKGNRMYEAVAKEVGFTFHKTSALVVATSKEEEVILEELFLRAVSRDIPVSYLTAKEAFAKEKNLSDQVTKAIELPSTGIIYPWEAAFALMEEAVMNGVVLKRNSQVIAIEQQDDSFRIQTSHEKLEALHIINAAGIYGDQIYQMIGGKGPLITPRRGEYYVLDRQKDPLVSHIIYPVPSALGKGVLAVPTTHNNILIGPNSEIIDDKEANNNTKEALETVKQQIQKTVKNIPMDKVIRIFAGIRATGNEGDFYIKEAKEAENFINVFCIDSPGLASAPAISEYVMETILSPKGILDHKKKNRYLHRKRPVVMKELSLEDKQQMIKDHPAYGRMICRCEEITEGEIQEAIRRPAGATTVKGIKMRVRPGMGRCQGGFCEPLVVDILAKEQHIEPWQVAFGDEEGGMLQKTLKGGLADA